VNGRTYTNRFDATNRTITFTTPASRPATSTVDAQGRPRQLCVPGVEPVTLAYDTMAAPRLSPRVSGAQCIHGLSVNLLNYQAEIWQNPADGTEFNCPRS
jgi:uncharacterized protein RhaS with RHS repeats